MIETNKFARRPFYVDAVQVTNENIDEVAKWCLGEVLVTEKLASAEEEKYIKVRVHRPLSERQTMAFVGNWVLYAGTGFKVYTPKAFENSFEVHDEEPKVWRDAGTGQYVTEAYAASHGDTTVGESGDG